MQTAQLFRENNFSALQSEMYVDPETNQPKEIDLVASRLTNIEQASLCVSFVIECKTTKYPWVLFTADTHHHQLPQSLMFYKITSDFGQSVFRRLGAFKEFTDSPLFNIPKNMGYGVVEALKKENCDVTYKASIGAVKASLYSVMRANNCDIDRPYAQMSYPTIIIDGKLFKASLNEKNDIALSEISSDILLFKNPLLTLSEAFINIVTLNYLENFIKEAHDSISLCFDLAKKEMPYVVNEWKKSKKPKRRRVISKGLSKY